MPLHLTTSHNLSATPAVKPSRDRSTRYFRLWLALICRQPSQRYSRSSHRRVYILADHSDKSSYKELIFVTPVIHVICYIFYALSTPCRLDQGRLGIVRGIGLATTPSRPAAGQVELVVPVAFELRVRDLGPPAALRLLVLLRGLAHGGLGLVAVGVGENVLGVDVALAVGLGDDLLGDDDVGGGLEETRLLGDQLAHVGEGVLDTGELYFALVDDLEEFIVLCDLGLVLAGCTGEAGETFL